jgi:hypothetical protein
MIREPAVDADGLSEQFRFFHGALEDWLREPDITVACGRWADGAIGELIPLGRGYLLPGIHEGGFAGVRELRLEESPHARALSRLQRNGLGRGRSDVP